MVRPINQTSSPDKNLFFGPQNELCPLCFYRVLQGGGPLSVPNSSSFGAVYLPKEDLAVEHLLEVYPNED
ncbi:MAG: hypothetical protein AMJ75_03975 [Phycisphaerae bacterium SM1_79]|nr:MAG: hypothetical protein AMJ75_03975 [Phycisphaerae bacterium SM1_79]